MKAILVVPFLFLAMSAFAGIASVEERDEVGTVYQGNLMSGKEDEAQIAADTHWDFITCTHDEHECSHEAQHHGYHHYYAVHDHARCPGHEHYACYGGHH